MLLPAFIRLSSLDDLYEVLWKLHSLHTLHSPASLLDCPIDLLCERGLLELQQLNHLTFHFPLCYSRAFLFERNSRAKKLIWLIISRGNFQIKFSCSAPKIELINCDARDFVNSINTPRTTLHTTCMTYSFSLLNIAPSGQKRFAEREKDSSSLQFEAWLTWGSPEENMGYMIQTTARNRRMTHNSMCPYHETISV